MSQVFKISVKELLHQPHSTRQQVLHFKLNPTLAWCRSTPYIESFLAFSKNNMSAWAGLIDLEKHSKDFKYLIKMLSSIFDSYVNTEAEGPCNLNLISSN